MNKIKILIPYLASEAQGNELELAVTGWRKHFINPHEIVVIGDHHPIVTTGDDISFIPCPRIDTDPGNYLPHIDMVTKFAIAYATFMMAGEGLDMGFIYTCDDIYPVNDFSIAEVLMPKVSERRMSEADADCTTGWWGDYQRTRRKCLEEGLPTMNWVCHLPVWYDWDSLMSIYEEYGCHKTSYVVENLYFNTYYRNRIPILIDGDDVFKYSVDNCPLDSYEFDRALKSRIFITNSVSGWSQELEDRLRKHYNKQ